MGSKFSLKHQVFRISTATCNSYTHKVIPPEEDAPILSAPTSISLDEPTVVWLEGTLTHALLDSCSLTIAVGEESILTANIKSDGTWKALVDISDYTQSLEIQTIAECGKFTPKSDTVVTQILLEDSGDDADGDGIQVLKLMSERLRCIRWLVIYRSKYQDNDGCHDLEEDFDDDNDGILDEQTLVLHHLVG